MEIRKYQGRLVKRNAEIDSSNEAGGLNLRKEGSKVVHLHTGRRAFGSSILKIQEIISTMPVTPVPRTPDFVKGVINTRLRFGMELTG